MICDEHMVELRSTYESTYHSYWVIRKKFMSSEDILCFCKRKNVKKLYY